MSLQFFLRSGNSFFKRLIIEIYVFITVYDYLSLFGIQQVVSYAKLLILDAVVTEVISRGLLGSDSLDATDVC